MSLVQKVEQSNSAAAGAILPKDTGRAGDPIIEKDNVSLLRRATAEPRGRFDFSLPSDRGAAKPPSKPPEAKRATTEVAGHAIAISLIDEVSSIIPLLIDENEALRTTLKRDRERLDADVERATLVACEWRKSAESAKLQVETLERKLAEVTERLDRAEAATASEKEHALKASREAAEAECLSSLFEEKLLSSFGAGSLFQTALERIRNRADDPAD